MNDFDLFALITDSHIDQQTSFTFHAKIQEHLSLVKVSYYTVTNGAALAAEQKIGKEINHSKSV